MFCLHANGFCINSDINLYGWKTEGTDSEECKLTILHNEFVYNDSEEFSPLIYEDNIYIYFVWYQRLAIRISREFNEIEYTFYSEEFSEDLTYALNFVLAFVAPCLNRIAVHGCAVVGDNNKAWIFLGNSGIGKSTLLKKLVELGYPYIAEEVLFIQKRENGYFVSPSNNLIRISKKEYSESKSNKVYVTDDEKIGYWNNEYKEAMVAVEIECIYVIERDKNKSSQIYRASKAQILQLLLQDYLYVKSIIRWLPFEKLVKLVLEFVMVNDFFYYRVCDYPLLEKIKDDRDTMAAIMNKTR